MVALEDVKKLKVQELKEELETLGLPTNGLKAELAERLEAALGGETAADVDVTADDAPAADAEVPVEPAAEAPAPAEPEPAAPAEPVAAEEPAPAETEEPAAPEVPQPTEGAVLTDAPTEAEAAPAEQETYDPVAAAQAQAQAIAAKFEQQQAAGEAVPGEDYGNKRKFEDEAGGDAGAEDQMRKRASFNGPEGGYNGGSKFSDAPTGFSDAPAGYAAEGGHAGYGELLGGNPGPGGPMGGGGGALNGGGMGGGGGGGAQMGPGGQFSAEVDIPAPMVGKLIGKGGETIKQLQYSTQTKVQIDHQSPGDLKRVTISGGSRETVEAAKKQVEQIVSTEDASGGGASRSVECPQGIVGRIIGRGGETIRALQQASEAHIVVNQNFPDGEPRQVNISGRPEAVERAVNMVQELISGEPGSAQAIIQKYGAGIQKEIPCPKGMVGRVIGKGGETIKALQKNFGANIQIDQTTDPMKITIAGQPPAVEACGAAVQEIVNGGNPYLGPAGGAGGYDAAGAGGGYGAGGYGGMPQYPSAYGGYGGYPQPQAAAAYGGYGAYGYPQPYAAQPAYGGYGSYGADPYAAAAGGGGGGYGGYGAGGGGAGGGGGGGGSSTWQELHDDQGRPYYYNTTTGASVWDKPAELA